MPAFHKSLTQEHWQEFGLSEQLGNVGSEVNRALQWRGRDEALYNNSLARAFELLDMTIQDLRWKTGLKEITRARELLGDAMYGGEEYKTSLEDLNDYFFQFALAARLKK